MNTFLAVNVTGFVISWMWQYWPLLEEMAAGHEDGSVMFVTVSDTVQKIYARHCPLWAIFSKHDIFGVCMCPTVLI